MRHTPLFGTRGWPDELHLDFDVVFEVFLELIRYQRYECMRRLVCS